ncbi:hypothetical protein pipiens_005998 [Culex pipiens pipiens]|uniref:Nop domain-containing protein n=1 Tax=Culex pipiens pipiens TaxID=38569 RepID=A0ABD1DU23_CULPP
MFVLYETPAGYAIFKLLDEKKLQQIDNLYLEFETPELANKVVKLKHFEKFADTTEALSAATAAVEGKVSKSLKKTLKKLVSDDVQNQLLVADAKLGSAIKDKLSLQCVSNTGVQELMRCIRSQSESLLSGLPKKEMTAMALGLAHSLSRYKLKFSPDKIDTMIVQAQCLLDDLDKELNNYMMRAREWYGWHFPELGKILTDNIAFIKTIKLVGTRDNMATTDLSDILPEELEEKVKEAAEISMGTEISEEDITNIQNLCDEILSINEYRTHLYDYLKTRMMAMAPNLTVLVGETIGARAEKALFRALKTKKDTPKYGLIFHASLIGSASAKNKGKISRSLAAKASLATRVDAFGEDVSMELGTEHRAKLEMRLRLLEEGNMSRLSGTGKAKAKLEKYHAKSEVKVFKSGEDSTLPIGKKRKLSEGAKIEEIEPEVKEEPSDEPSAGESSKKKKKNKQKDLDASTDEVAHASKKIKTEDEETPPEEGAEPQSEKKKKKKKKRESQAAQPEEDEEEPAVTEVPETPTSQKKKEKEGEGRK